MRLKRLYDHSSGSPVVSGIKVLKAGVRQHFSPNLVSGGAAEGWLTLGRGQLTIHGVDGDVVYQMVRTPGHYCCHCDVRIDDAGEFYEPGLTRGQRHVALHHAGAPSPDPSNPAGYRREDYYTGITLEAVDAQTPEEARALDRKIREAFVAKLGEKYRGRRVLPPIAGGADLVFNIAKGRVAELYNRVDTNDPANSALIIVVIDANGDTDATMRDRDTLSALLGGTANEVTNTNYARKVLTDSDLSAFAPDDTNDRVDLDIPDQTFTAIAAGTTWTDLLTCFDNDTTGGDDTNIVPMTLHDFAVTPDGSDIVAQIATAGFFRAS